MNTKLKVINQKLQPAFPHLRAGICFYRIENDINMICVEFSWSQWKTVQWNSL